MAYNYTKPRVPVAATYSGPGPTYGLPSLVGQKNHDPRSVHARGPAYPFGLSRSKSEEFCGPGPSYIEAKLYRTGRDTAPAYTMCGKRRDENGASQPGPTDYVCANQNIVSGRHKAPAYSFGLGRKSRDGDVTPGMLRYENCFIICILVIYSLVILGLIIYILVVCILVIYILVIYILIVYILVIYIRLIYILVIFSMVFNNL